MQTSPDFELRDGWQPNPVSRHNFPLPGLRKKLQAMAEKLEHGRGAAMTRIMPEDDYSLEDLGILHAGINANLGEWVPQSFAGLRSKSRGFGLPLGKVYAEMKGNTPSQGKQAKNHFRLHTVGWDVVTFLCVRPAAVGGASRVTSAVRVYHTIARECPDLYARLDRPYTDLPSWSVFKFTSQVSPS